MFIHLTNNVDITIVLIIYILLVFNVFLNEFCSVVIKLNNNIYIHNLM